MYSREELVDAINQLLESSHHSIQNCEKLAAVYTVLDHISPDAQPHVNSFSSYEVKQDIIGVYGDSKFLQAIAGKDTQAVWKIMNEMMDAISVLNPKLHKAVLSRLSSLDDKSIN